MAVVMGRNSKLTHLSKKLNHSDTFYFFPYMANQGAEYTNVPPNENESQRQNLHTCEQVRMICLNDGTYTLLSLGAFE